MPLADIVQEVRELAARVDVSLLSSEDAIELATDVYPIDAQLAVSLLRKATQGDVDDTSLEIAIARVSVSALTSRLSTESERGGDIHQSTPLDLVGDEKLRKLLEASAGFYRAKDAIELLEATRDIEDASERLFVQRKWITQHSRREDVIDVIEATVANAISESQFTANATFYREIVAPLPYCSTSYRRKAIVEIVEGQESVIKKRGPTVDFVRLQLILAECDCMDGELVKAVERMLVLYLETVGTLDELEMKVTCLAWLSANFGVYRALQDLPDFIELREMIDSEVEETLQQILNDGADHFAILTDALRAFARRVPDKAKQIANQLNTIDRRNMARYRIMRTMCMSTSQVPPVDILFSIFDDLEEGAEFGPALHDIAKRVCRGIENGEFAAESLTEIYARIDTGQSSVTKLKILGELAQTSESGEYHEDFIAGIHKRFLEEFAAIANPRAKYTVACELIAKLNSSVPSLANALFKHLTGSDRRAAISEDVERGSYYVLDLLVKSASALAKCRLLSDGDVERVRSVIAKIEDPYRKTTLFGRLAFFFWREDESKVFSEIVNRDIWPVLTDLEGKDPRTQHQSWRNAYPVVWLEDRVRARHATQGFPESVRNACASAACFSLLRAQPPGEPFDDDAKKRKANFDYSAIQKLLELCEETTEDNVIFVVFDWIAREVSIRHGGVRTTKDQQAEICRRMLEIADRHLPIRSRIRHEGYKILCQVAALRVQMPSSPSWNDLIKAGERIGNAADRVFVLAHLASCIPNRMRKLRMQILGNAEESAEDIRSAEDRFHRYYTLATIAAERDRDVAIRMLKKAFKVVVQERGRRNAIREHKVIDFAYMLDSELPAELASLYDDDPAREQYRERVASQVQEHELKRQIASHSDDVDLNSVRNDESLASAAWEALGALNAGRMVPTDVARSRDMLACASRYPLDTSYPMYSWAMSNVSLRYANTPDGNVYLRNIFEGVLSGVEFFLQTTEGKGAFGDSLVWRDLGDDSGHLIVGVGEQEKGLKFLKNWLRKNAEESVTLVYPYFSSEDLFFLGIIMEVDPKLCVKIVTGDNADQDKLGNLQSSYSSEWRQRFGHSPPETEIVVVRLVESGRFPIHDRWILSKSVGVRIGTSLNGLGNRESEISELSGEEHGRVYRLVQRYLTKEVRVLDGERVAYQFFDLVG